MYLASLGVSQETHGFGNILRGTVVFVYILSGGVVTVAGIFVDSEILRPLRFLEILVLRTRVWLVLTFHLIY